VIWGMRFALALSVVRRKMTQRIWSELDSFSQEFRFLRWFPLSPKKSWDSWRETRKTVRAPSFCPFKGLWGSGLG